MHPDRRFIAAVRQHPDLEWVVSTSFVNKRAHQLLANSLILPIAADVYFLEQELRFDAVGPPESIPVQRADRSAIAIRDEHIAG